MPHRNEAMYRAMVEIRRSSAASPHKNKAKYNRKAKHRGRRFNDSWDSA